LVVQGVDQRPDGLLELEVLLLQHADLRHHLLVFLVGGGGGDRGGGDQRDGGDEGRCEAPRACLTERTDSHG
jgi:hypothetical protein